MQARQKADLLDHLAAELTPCSRVTSLRRVDGVSLSTPDSGIGKSRRSSSQTSVEIQAQLAPRFY
jgi:hypothetical protein